MKHLFVESLHQLTDDEREQLDRIFAAAELPPDIKIVILPANVFVSEENPGGYVIEETEQEEGEAAPRITRRLVFPDKRDFYDFLASPEFQGLQAEAADDE